MESSYLHVDMCLEFSSRVRVGKMGEGGQKVQISSNKINKSLGV